MRFTKIVCTIGPASSDPETLTQLIEAGMDVARINFSHGDHDGHARIISRVRAIADKLDRTVAILADLQGPKLRVGQLPEQGLRLQSGSVVTLSTRPNQEETIPCQYKDLHKLVRSGDRMLLDDGLMELEVVETDDGMIATRVVTGGRLYSNKGINLPQADSRIPAITEKDEHDLSFAVRQQVDWIALSFVRTAQEVLDLVALIRKQSRSGLIPQVLAKIEKPEAVANIESIVQVADGIMVARGDLGIELPTEDVPMIQKEIIELCNKTGKPVITATQMLDSMIRNPRPTRAEASDVANAVLDGTDAVMLSGETAVGKYPVRTVQMMERIVTKAEATLPVQSSHNEIVAEINFAAQAIANAASDLATSLGAAAIIAPTSSGYTARKLSHNRPAVPIIAVTPSPKVRCQLNLFWGVYPLFSSRRDTTDEVIEDAVQLTLDKGLIHEGDLVVITAGAAGSTPGTTNLIKLQLIEHVLARGQGLGDQKVRGRIRKLRSPLPANIQIDVDDIVVAQAFDGSWQHLLTPACGIICEVGSSQSVAVRLAQDLKIPAIVAAANAFEVLQDRELVVLDPIRGLVYRGLNLDDTRNGEGKATTPQPRGGAN